MAVLTFDYGSDGIDFILIIESRKSRLKRYSAIKPNCKRHGDQL